MFEKIETVDFYINYVCGIRCTHCFIGENLNSNIEMHLEQIKIIVSDLKHRDVKCITLLGGEPSLHKNINDVISFIIKNGMGVRVVSNGQKPFQKMIKSLNEDEKSKLKVCFSIDGSNAEINNSIRGKNVFENLLDSIQLVQNNNIQYSGITSISKDNFSDVESIINTSYELGMEYLNIHYVTDRGFALKNKVVDVTLWKGLIKKLENSKNEIPIRIEKTFVSLDRNVTCEVNNKENIIIDPNGFIFGCTMFMNRNQLASAKYINGEITISQQSKNESTICKCVKSGCPAIPLINNDIFNEALSQELKFDCIFNKTTL
jgi:MoaA/NifB/PqqE/SkfB family radical SAM enzyme